MVEGNMRQRMRGLKRGGVRLLITGPQGFERTAMFPPDAPAATITERVRETIEG